MRFNAFGRTLFGVMVVALSTQPMVGQISPVGPAWIGETSYNQAANDAVFCFLSSTDISLSYVVPGESGDFNFSWYQYQQAGNSWDIPYSSNAGSSSVVSGLTPGGYRVVATNNLGDEVSEERCWVFNPALTNPAIELIYDDCFSVEYQASCDSLALAYYDPDNGQSGFLPYQRVYNWSALPEQWETKTGSRVSVPAPFEDVAYVLTVSDRFGNRVETSANYQAIAVEADFEATVMKPDVMNERHTEVSGSSPLEVRFSDTSKGFVSAWEWTFGESGRAVEPDPFFVFTEAGHHSVELRVVNRNSGCEDVTDEDALVVNVSEAELEVPNVFSPNDDGKNDEFRVAYRSLKKFEMVVFNRWGRKVYQSSDPAQGWDGTIGNKVAAPGVYFYYITGEGYNEGEVFELKGPVHLFRGKN